MIGAEKEITYFNQVFITHFENRKLKYSFPVSHDTQIIPVIALTTAATMVP